MKIAFLADLHLGYERFEEDAFNQAKTALKKANELADIIVIAGDIFDERVPRLETLKRFLDILKEIQKPIIAIHGNHERRGSEQTNVLEIFNFSQNFKYCKSGEIVEKKINENKIYFVCMNNIPEAFAKNGLIKINEKLKEIKDGFKIVIIHQNIKELTYGEENTIEIEDLFKLDADLVVNGHIHKAGVYYNGKIIVPGSTVITQLKKDEEGERGFYTYDIRERKIEFIEIPSRKFKVVDLEFANATIEEVEEKVKRTIEEIRKNFSNAIIKIRLYGKLRENVDNNAIFFKKEKDIFIENYLNSEENKKLNFIRAEKIDNLSAKEKAIKIFNDMIKNKITLFDSIEFLEHACEGKGKEYLEEKRVID